MRTRYTFFIDDDVREALAVLKERDGISESEAIRRALRDFLAKRKVRIGAKSARKGGTAKRKK